MLLLICHLFCGHHLQYDFNCKQMALTHILDTQAIYYMPLYY
jgi:hypothetical protein